MKKLSVLLLGLFVVSCGGGDGDGDGDGDYGYNCSVSRVRIEWPSFNYQPAENLLGTWECDYGSFTSTETYNADGTYSASYDSMPSESHNLDVWEECRIGTRPPNGKGWWKTVPRDNGVFYYCQRSDNDLATVLCGDIIFETPDLLRIPPQTPRAFSNSGTIGLPINQTAYCERVN